jgi:outer membrane translocation and assembly module TamA
MLPFGWLLVEPSDELDIPALRDWCEAQPKPDLSSVRRRLTESRERAAAEAAAAEAQARERVALAQEQERLQAEREARRAALSEQGKLVEDLRARLTRHSGPRQPVSGALYAEVQKLLKPALQENWSDADKQALADLILGVAFEKIDFGGKAKDVKRAVVQLKGDA